MARNYYAVIEKDTCRCCQIINSPVSDWSINNARHYSMPLPRYDKEYLDKYFYNDKWWVRTYNRYETIVEKDENGVVLYEEKVPLPEYGFNDSEWVCE